MVERSRRTILETLNASVNLTVAPEIQAYIKDYGVDAQRFPEATQRGTSPYDDNPTVWRCTGQQYVTEPVKT
ncbi:MAG UNVERIFIED_CONTAM: hypothetical protein LVT10_19300, partial [Anaerolineae bacterium]